MKAIMRLCWLGIAISVHSVALAHEVLVTGTVRTPEGEPVVAARVRVPALSTTVTTDSTGAFRFSAAGSPAPDRIVRLLIERIGFVPRDTLVALSSPAIHVAIVMRALPQPLDETIVTGTAGPRSRFTQPGLVTTVSVTDLSRTTPLSTLPEALQGRVTSLDLTPSDGSVGESQRLWIRGAASIAISNEPLVFLDGVRIDTRSQRATTNVGGQASSRLFDIDPADIERIEIAKGPAAATLYGTDAAGGVIQIFTKRSAQGEGGGMQSFELQAGLIDPNWDPPTNYGICGAADVLSSSSATLCHGRQPGDVIADNPLQRSNVPSTGDTWAARWAGSGGGTSLRANASINIERQTGALPQNRFDRNAFRLGTTWEGASSLRVDAGIGLMATNTALPQNADNPEGILVTGLLGNPLTVGGSLGGWARTPVEALAEVEQRNSVLRATPTLQLTHSLGPVSQRLIAGIDATSSNGVFFVPLRSDGAFQGSWGTGVTGEDHARYAVRTLDYLATVAVRDPSKSFVGVNLSAGAQFVQTDEDRFQVTGFGLVTNDARRVSDAADRRGNQTLLLRTRSLGYFAQVETSVHDRLFLQAGARSDYQSAFGSEAGAPWFPKAGLSYLMIDRSRESHNQFIERLRLRAAFGTSGRAPPQGEAGVTFSAAPFIIEPGRVAQGVVPASPGNDRLRPERSRELEVGLDAELLDDRFGLELTRFDKRSKDLLFRLAVPPSFGFRLNPMTNIGSVANSGWEVTGRWSVAVGRAALSGQAGVSTLSNRVLDFGDARSAAAASGVRENLPLGALLDRPVLRIDTVAGRAIVGDTAEFVAPAMPSRTGFVGANVSVGSRWHLAVTFDGKRGNAMNNTTNSFRDRQARNGYRSAHMNELSPEERLRRFGPFVTESGTAVSSNNVLGPYLQDASFVRWREASITWDLPYAFARRLGGRSASLTAAGRNLLLWTRYDGDPETVTYISEVVLGGTFQFNQFNFMSMPQARRWVMRVAVRY
jgi:outer membrane receptor protein involved in Fe transport